MSYSVRSQHLAKSTHRGRQVYSRLHLDLMESQLQG